jgi:mersacidin/lichenicidin family type 2 lantibiotic
MTTEEVIRSWKDEDFRSSLSDAEQALLPENPAGLVELTDEELQQLDIAGGSTAPCGAIVASIVVSVVATAIVSIVYTEMAGCVYA